MMNNIITLLALAFALVAGTAVADMAVVTVVTFTEQVVADGGCNSC